MSFVDEEDIFTYMENLTRYIFQTVKDIKLPDPFPRMTYAKAMERYGSDKPDIRYEMELIDVKFFTDGSDFKAFSDAESVKALLVKTGAKYSRKVIDDLTDKAKKYGAKGLAWMKFQDGNFNGGISKFFSESMQKNISENLKVENEDILLLVGDDKNVVTKVLGKLRTVIASKENLANENEFKPLLVTEFHMFDIDNDNNSTIYLGAEIGVYKKEMNASTWELLNENLPNTTIMELEIVKGSNTVSYTHLTLPTIYSV